MYNLKDFIIEKLHVNKDMKPNKKKEYSDEDIKDLLSKYTRNDIPSGLKNDMFFKTPQSEWTNMEKMEGYYKKGSKPERLVATIKNREKMIKRWIAAMDLEWEEAADVFRDEIIKRGYYTEQDLFIFVLIMRVKSNIDKYKKFLW